MDSAAQEDVNNKSEIVEIQGKPGDGDFLIVCEHASNFIPSEFDNLGLDEEVLSSHIAWDPGAVHVARSLSKILNSSLVAQTVSRLIYDCNRSLEAEDAAPFKTERGLVPGNMDLSFAEIRRRFEAYYVPFWKAIDNQLNQGDQKAFVTVHSFTPIYEGSVRAVEIGILHDEESPFADILLEVMTASGDYNVRRNEPYAPIDGVTHTLKEHAVSRGLPNVMIEIRNDLLETEADCIKMAEWLGAMLTLGLARLLENSK